MTVSLRAQCREENAVIGRKLQGRKDHVFFVNLWECGSACLSMYVCDCGFVEAGWRIQIICSHRKFKVRPRLWLRPSNFHIQHILTILAIARAKTYVGAKNHLFAGVIFADASCIEVLLVKQNKIL